MIFKFLTKTVIKFGLLSCWPAIIGSSLTPSFTGKFLCFLCACLTLSCVFQTSKDWPEQTVVVVLPVFFAYPVSSTLSWCFHIPAVSQVDWTLSFSSLQHFRIKPYLIKAIHFNSDSDCKYHSFGGSTQIQLQEAWNCYTNIHPQPSLLYTCFTVESQELSKPSHLSFFEDLPVISWATSQNHYSSKTYWNWYKDWPHKNQYEGFTKHVYNK